MLQSMRQFASPLVEFTRLSLITNPPTYTNIHTFLKYMQ
jgi:hypothetical protein